MAATCLLANAAGIAGGLNLSGASVLVGLVVDVPGGDWSQPAVIPRGLFVVIVIAD